MISGDAAVVTTTVAMLFSDIEGSTRLLQQLGADYPDVLICLENGDATSAATLLAAAEVGLPADAPVLPVVTRKFDALVARAKSALGEAAFKAAWDKGAALDLPAALALAKSLPPPF